ncbi:zinc finger protein 28-like [Centropristis striata]|uniref:zinc finger protein 28-like n=1 Tax=Centropristis striata TaxID=184440 RepID=UPI0027DF9B36|nr:zinc finger protein 28-like [Centropristis striata]
MCSVVGCDSWRRSAQGFKLPEDPERRLEWVQFILEVNGQRLKESSWTDISICHEHFTVDCFVNLTPTGTVQLKPSAVPSLCVKSEPDEPLESPQYVEPEETTDSPHQWEDDFKIIIPTSYSEKSEHTVTGSQASPVSSPVSVSNVPDASNSVSSGSKRKKQKGMKDDLNKEKAVPQHMTGKHVVNEKCLLQLFRRKCPSCGCKLQMEKVTYGALIMLNQQCLQCEYRYQWKSQINTSVPTAEDSNLTGGTGVTSDIQQEMPTDDNPSSAVTSEIVTFSDEESNPSDGGEEGDEEEVSSDGEWNPTEDFLLAEELTKELEEESEDEGEEEEDLDSPGGLKINELCTECGSFFNIQKPHTCEHKIKPYSCNICGKRCVTETSLKNHSRIHDETYDHPCKYCHVTFKTRADKLKHEQIHQDSKDPYKCPDCPETFKSSKERSVHLANHRTEKEYKCGVCGIAFKDVHHLRRHSVVHTGLKPYKCSVCQRGFNQTSHLKSHMRLHTGERPYKCKHCDKSFNHNVSLKSHVQRYHSSGSGRERKKAKIDERASDTGDAEDSENKKGSDSEFDNVEENTEEEVQEERTEVRKGRKRSTGRPRGRPKRNEEGNLKGQRSKRKTAKSKAQKLKKSGSSDEESEDEQSYSDMSYDSAEEEEEEEEEEEKETERKSTRRSRARPKNDSDSDFDPEDKTKKKRYSSDKTSEKHSGRPKRNLEF